MVCNNIERIHNCARCEFKYTDYSILKNTDAFNIVTTAASILWNSKFSEHEIYSAVEYSVTVSCTGAVHVALNPDGSILSYDTAIDVYTNILNTWCDVNSNSECAPYKERVLQTVQQVRQTSNINNVRQKSVSLANHIAISIRCDKKSIATVTDNVLSSKTFTLSDLSATSRLTSIALTDLLNTVIRYIADLTVPTLFINADTCYVTYTGSILFSTHLVFCKSNLRATKHMYSLYLNAWCKGNFTKCSEIVKIKRSIGQGNRARDLTELHEVSIRLLNDLSPSI